MPEPLSIVELLKRTKTGLAPWLAANKAQLSIASDELDALEILQNSPVGLRVVLLWNGDDLASSNAGGIVNNSLAVIVSYTRGLKLASASAKIEARPGQKPLFEIVENLRAAIRVIQITEAEETVAQHNLQYVGTKPYALPDNMPLDAYQLSWTLHAVIS